ncbi:MAG TPA: dihydrolipoamide acetyltransferase family protein [Vicinamibacterales bacterium]|nr:dihydrolipoamide acetyltransferase family protein [Vicinamibacterales bacterium]
MPTNVVMPQMGESIAEGTIVRWIKKVGEAVDRDEPLFEISTDKVDAEIPSPGAGVLTEIKAKEGETVPVNSVVAVIASADDPATSRPAPAPPSPGASGLPEAAAGQPESSPALQPAFKAEFMEDLPRQKSSPLVRRIAREHNVDIRQINGTGISGRVTKHDILGFIETTPRDPARREPLTPAARPSGYVPTFKPGDKVEIVPMTIMRKKIAEHMVASARTSPHVYSVYEVDFHRVSQLRDRKKAQYEQSGTKLTFTAIVAKVVVDALRAFPFVNASIDGDNVVYKKDINLGIAVALDSGLIVPVLKHADEKNLLGLSRGIVDLAERARAKQLKPEEVHDGTFTITNPGQFGAQFGMPIINQPQVAILGVGTIEKRPVVVDDAIAIRTMAYLTLGFDHRLIDGAVADEFMAFVKNQLENFDANQV